MAFSDWLEQPPTSGRGITFLSDGAPERVAWERMYEDALRAAGAIQARGAGTVGLLGGGTRAIVTALLGCMVAGARPMVLPTPNTRRQDTGTASAGRLLRRLGVELIVHDPPFEALARSFEGVPAVAARGLDASGAVRARPARDDVVLLQLTSGTTEHARAVQVTDACLRAYADALGPALRREYDRDLQLSWLPLHYDLGLISGLLTAAGWGMEFALASPELFIRAPGRWMRWMSELEASDTLAPSFAYGIAAAMPAAGVDLSRCRMTANGGEMVDPIASRRFLEAFAPHGLDAGVMSSGYGLAEATSAVTVRTPGGGLLTDVVDRAVLEHEGVAAPAAPDAGGACREVASNGPPLPGVGVRIVDPVGGAPLDERRVGEIEVSGPTVAAGYRGEPEQSAAIMRDGWLRTGDLGYLAGGELYPCGRLKDLIIAAGRNIAPEQIEEATAALEGIRRGNVIAFSIQGAAREEIVVVAEARDASNGLRDAVAREVRAEVGLTPHDVVLIAPGTLPKTASGKLQRAACRARYLSGELAAR